jgi:hypothetical protein
MEADAPANEDPTQGNKIDLPRNQTVTKHAIYGVNRMRRSSNCMLLVWLVFFSPSINAQVPDPNEKKQVVISEWASHLQMVKSAKWDSKIEYYDGGDPNRPDDARVTRTDLTRHAFFCETGTLWHQEAEYADREKKGARRNYWNKIAIVNRKYAAELTKDKGKEGWLLAGVRIDEKALSEAARKEVFFPWMQVGNLRLDSCLVEPEFEFTKTEPVFGKTSSGLLKLHFVYRSYYPDEPHEAAFANKKTGFVIFDSAHSFRPVEYSFGFESPTEEGTSYGVIEYETGTGTPIAKVITNEVKARLVKKNTSVYGKTVETFSNVRYNGGVGEDEFRLSYYDLPEPVGAVWPRKTRWWLWISLAAVVAIAISSIMVVLKNVYFKVPTPDEAKINTKEGQ